MGNISSRQEDVPGSMLYLKDQHRFSIKSLTVTNARNKKLLTVTPSGFPASKVSVRREPGDETPISYIQDPEQASGGFLLRLDLEDELDFHFTFSVRQVAPAPALTAASPPPSSGTDTTITGLTFAFASNPRELDTLITREFHSDPNLHKNSNVQLIGDMATRGSPSVEHEWSWRWRPPRTNEDKGGGWRNNCSFLEYDSRAHRLNTLTSFAFWVQKPVGPILTPLMSPPAELMIPPTRYRMPSSQSYQSAMSDSEGPADSAAPASPVLPPSELSSSASTAVAPSLPAVDVVRPAEDMSSVEDGPVFRANMKSLEQKTGTMRVQIKKVLKKAEAAQQTQVEANEATRAFLVALQEASSSNASAFKPALEHYFSNIARRILQYEEENGKLLRRQIIEPLSRLYTNDIKQAEAKKKDFEEESREYYAYVGRYLGQRQDSLKEKKRAESDSKYQSKRRNFELKRFDYSNFMQDLHGGRKEQELLSQLTKYADGQAKAFQTTAKQIENLQPRLDALVHEVSEADKEYKIQRTEREEKRRNLEMNNPASAPLETEVGTYPILNPSTSIQQNGSTGYTSDTDLSRADSTSSQFGSGYRAGLSPSNSVSKSGTNGALSTSPGSALTSSSSNKFRGIRDLEERDPVITGLEKQQSSQARKEGLLWALSKPGSHIDPKGINKQAWHKFWIVLDQGRLSEYSNWKDKMELHRDPIDLRMASVRMARDAERRFCFEVITPQYRRIYQATTEEEMNVWISSINNALQSAFEGRGAPKTPVGRLDQSGSEYGAMLTGKSLSQSGPHGSSNRPDPVGVNRRVTVGSRPPYMQSHGDVPDESPTKLLEQIRNNDQGNQYCADCNTNTKVEWVSLNLGIVLCIECGGIHRSLGTHVSKVRSLTLDTQSFTTDIVELLMLIGNRISNMVWEAKLDQRNKPEPWANRELRLRFITAKYVERAYVEPMSATAHFNTAEENLLMSIKKNDIQGVLLAIAQRANVNVHDGSRHTHAVFLALAAADPAAPSSASTSPAATPNPARKDSGPLIKAFPVAELLVQTGAEIPVQMPAIPLSSAAQLYVEQRTARATLAADTLGPLPVVSGTKSADQAKLQKRGSAGSRLAGKVTGLTER